jgi:hypothetical protein
MVDAGFVVIRAALVFAVYKVVKVVIGFFRIIVLIVGGCFIIIIIIIFIIAVS